ncbi:Bax inhibitor-1/YccA family protein [Actinokineospora auranticolor]|uniref:Putative YccA/Bax inhibitor family protein n=1 Tax=Actinokineospora auranticolor TaxID=155976 RepID=A0A2S6GYI8_9PSEU|nr:Bax inhibitor-1/YccA family protein [Actinokineospora auranticolor]PPK70294.1 putative YccA/Bax inhibitor family protein [Actinokineospora auranticolor]
MRSTSNPAFRNLPQGGYAGFQPQAQGYQQGPEYIGYSAPVTNERPMTVDDVVTKTAATLGVGLVTGIITAIATVSQSINPFGPMIGGLIVGLVLSLVIIFRRKAPSPALVLTYAAAEGVFLGAITGVLERYVPGIGLQAIMGTGLVFITMLIVYKTGAVKVTPRLTKWIIGATGAAAGLLLINLLLSWMGIQTGLRGSGPLGIVISLVIIGIAAFNFLLDFDQADQMIRSGTPAKWAWYVAFGLMATLVWLYFEILRLLWILQSSD